MPFSLSVIRAMNYLVQLVNLLILIRVVFSWINPDPRNTLVALVYNVTEPILSPIRDLIYNKLGYSGMIDFSPIAAIFLVNFLYEQVILRILVMFLF